MLFEIFEKNIYIEYLNKRKLLLDSKFKIVLDTTFKRP